MHLHANMTGHLAAGRQGELRRRADRARLAATARGGVERSGLVARLVGWWRSDVAPAPAGPDGTALARAVIDLTERGELMSTLRNQHEPIDAPAPEAAARRD